MGNIELCTLQCKKKTPHIVFDSCPTIYFGNADPNPAPACHSTLSARFSTIANERGQKEKESYFLRTAAEM